MVNFEEISRIVLDNLSEKPVSADRFSTGHCHFVFDVKTESGKKFVVRIAQPENGYLLESAVYWSAALKPKGVPLPEIIASDSSAQLPYLILERLPGKDLWQVYAELTKSEKKTLAVEMTRLQTLAATLPKAKSFGYLETYCSDSGCRTWFEVLLKYLERSRSRIKKTGFFDTEIVDSVEKIAMHYESYFSRIEPIPFFDDITTKNVIVNKGKLSGIVDVDWMCFGDCIQTIALTQTALLTSDCETDYIEFWCDAMNLDAVQRKVLNLYSAMSCVDFISEIGQTFNKEEPLKVDDKKVKKFFEILDYLLASV
ncbi:MAG: phosphotransferase [Actinomycetota bacterium]